MKKFLCCTLLAMLAMTISAAAQMKAYSPPEQDIGYEQVATLSVDGMTVVSFDSQFNIVDWQTPVMLNQEVSNVSAQVVGAFTIPTELGNVSMTLVCYQWPTTKNDAMNHRNDANYVKAPPVNYDSFTTSRTDFTL